jgi:hypothetical protein
MTDSTAPFADDPQGESARQKRTVTNDAVAGETVEPADSYAGPDGAQPREAEPTYSPDERIPPEDIAPEELMVEETEPSESGSPDIGRES